MKVIKMLKTMANATMNAHVGQVLNVEDKFADELLKDNACEVLEEIIDVVEYVEVKEEAVQEVEVEKTIHTFNKKRK